MVHACTQPEPPPNHPTINQPPRAFPDLHRCPMPHPHSHPHTHTHITPPLAATSGTAAKKALVDTGVDKRVLRSLWPLADMDRDGKGKRRSIDRCVHVIDIYMYIYACGCVYVFVCEGGSEGMGELMWWVDTHVCARFVHAPSQRGDRRRVGSMPPSCPSYSPIPLNQPTSQSTNPHSPT